MNEEKLFNKSDFEDLVGKVVSLTLWDECDGKCEILSVTEEKLTVHWISYCACYSCCVYSKAVYTEPYEVKYDSVAKIGNVITMTREEIETERDSHIKHDECIFRRYDKLIEELEKNKGGN